MRLRALSRPRPRVCDAIKPQNLNPLALRPNLSPRYRLASVLGSVGAIELQERVEEGWMARFLWLLASVRGAQASVIAVPMSACLR